MKKRDSKAFNESTGSWFIQGLDEERMAQLAANDVAPRASSWSALLERLNQMLRRG